MKLSTFSYAGFAVLGGFVVRIIRYGVIDIIGRVLLIVGIALLLVDVVRYFIKVKSSHRK